jgi:hypothetical protein
LEALTGDRRAALKRLVEVGVAVAVVRQRVAGLIGDDR